MKMGLIKMGAVLFKYNAWRTTNFGLTSKTSGRLASLIINNCSILLIWVNGQGSSGCSPKSAVPPVQLCWVLLHTHFKVKALHHCRYFRACVSPRQDHKGSCELM